MRKKKKKSSVTKGEKILYGSAIFAFFLTSVLQIFCGTNIGNLKLEVEKVKYEITDQEKKNESLTMKVSELTSFDKVKDIVKDMGLEYNNDNIIIINQNWGEKCGTERPKYETMEIS